MKKVILLAIVAICSCSITAIGQTMADSIGMVQLQSGIFVISNVEKVENKTTSELYKSALMWATDNFIADRTKYLVKDLETGVLVINGVSKQNDNLKFKLTIQVKENRYKWEVTEIYRDFKSSTMAEMFNMTIEEYQKDDKDINSKLRYVFLNFKTMIQDLEVKMQNKDNW